MSELKEYEIPAGVQVRVTTTPVSSPTVLVDGIKGVAVTKSQIRLSFIENILDTSSEKSGSEAIIGRHVLNLAMDREAFAAIMGLLNHVLADLDLRDA